MRGPEFPSSNEHESVPRREEEWNGEPSDIELAAILAQQLDSLSSPGVSLAEYEKNRKEYLIEAKHFLDNPASKDPEALRLLREAVDRAERLH